MNRVEGVWGSSCTGLPLTVTFILDPLSLDGFAVMTFCFHPSCCSGGVNIVSTKEFSAGMPEVYRFDQGKPVIFLLSSGLSCVWLLDLFLLDRLVTERI